MARRFRPQSTPGENVRIVARSIPWKLLILIPLLLVVAVPAYLVATNVGKGVIPGVTKYFYGLSGPPSPAVPTPQPAFPTVLPQAGSLLYTVQGGDSCDSILTYQMRMANAGQVFSDVNPNTVKALNSALGQDCHALQPGMVLPLSPQYPLIALGGVVQKIDASASLADAAHQNLWSAVTRRLYGWLPAYSEGGTTGRHTPISADDDHHQGWLMGLGTGYACTQKRIRLPQLSLCRSQSITQRHDASCLRLPVR